jgi:hypothetical protein
MKNDEDRKPDVREALGTAYRTLFAPRDTLIAALAAATSAEHAYTIVDALEQYLADGEGRAATPLLERLVDNSPAEIAQLKQERDEALARAEKAEQALRATPPGEEAPDYEAIGRAFVDFLPKTKR